ncbi:MULTISPECIES: hypothetical protein [unclassified Salinisphaera]|uniref:hypothetical protein n=1 Tax=unclassified Salinisphaera TaxID=2649847 RepID=UPI0025F9F135|nr:hypothetical protein [Salinisphaera sp.]|tara:strand:+ start:1231 stop:1554 length:324 start_codon:yes stop_codon:yes gene_type:complete
MKVTAWNNGKHSSSGAGYGLKLAATDRDHFFYKSWEVVSIKLPNGKVTQVNIDKASFWGSTCRELIDQKIGQWLIEARKAPWPSGSPPKFELVPKLKGHFELREIET